MLQQARKYFLIFSSELSIFSWICLIVSRQCKNKGKWWWEFVGIVLTLIISIVLAGILALCARPISNIYNTTEMIKDMATKFMWVSAIFMSFDAITTSCYFTLRSGGKTFITFIFDSFFLWVFFVSSAFILSRFTDLPIFAIYFIVNSFFIVKSTIGLIMVKSKKWVVNLVENK